MLNKDLGPELFEDSSSDGDEADDRKPGYYDHSDDSGSEEMTMSFKFNKDHCLTVFNILKNGGSLNQNNYFDMQRGAPNQNPNSAYCYLNGQTRAEYQRSLSLIDLQLAELFPKKKTAAEKQVSGSNSLADSSGSSEHEPPQSLREIFQISNNNRKRNKQRKKSKLESCAQAFSQSS